MNPYRITSYTKVRERIGISWHTPGPHWFIKMTGVDITFLSGSRLTSWHAVGFSMGAWPKISDSDIIKLCDNYRYIIYWAGWYISKFVELYLWVTWLESMPDCWLEQLIYVMVIFTTYRRRLGLYSQIGQGCILAKIDTSWKFVMWLNNI
jgi:hypothetical protein